MSTNIHFEAIRDILVIKTNKIEKQSIKFDTWQTPSAVTRSILEAGDSISAYKDWVMSQSTEDTEFDIFDDNDIFEDGEPIGKGFFNVGKDHIALFNDWLNMCDENGYIVTAFGF